MANGRGYGRTEREEDFEEEEVWAAVKWERKDSSPKSRRAKDFFFSSPRLIPSSARKIPKPHFNEEGDKRVFQQSAPVNIPDWSQIWMKGSPERDKGIEEGGVDVGVEIGDDGDDGDEEDDDIVPPHEWIARKLERSQIPSFSVCEGAGRTLKGRDLSKVRDAVLTRTGFLE